MLQTFLCVTVGGEVSVVLAPGPAENREAGGLGRVQFKLVHLSNVAETSHEQWGLLQNGFNGFNGLLQNGSSPEMHGSKWSTLSSRGHGHNLLPGGYNYYDIN